MKKLQISSDVIIPFTKEETENIYAINKFVERGAFVRLLKFKHGKGDQYNSGNKYRIIIRKNKKFYWYLNGKPLPFQKRKKVIEIYNGIDHIKEDGMVIYLNKI